MSSLRTQVINLYKNLLYYGKDYPLGNDYFITRLRKAFNSNRTISDPVQIEQLIKRGEFVIKEIDALYKLKKYHLDDLNKQLDSCLDEKLVLVTTSSSKHDLLLDQLNSKYKVFNFIRSNLFYDQAAKFFSSLTKDNFLLNTYINADYLVYNFECLETKPFDEGLNFLSKKITLDKFNLKLKHSISIIEKCLKNRANNSQTCISFNGGKDCCVVLFLFYACALRIGYKFPLNLLIINIKNSFPEMDFFIDTIIKNFYKQSLNLIIFDDTSKSLKDCLCDLKLSHPDLDSILMGTRRTDGSYFKTMPEFAPTDKDWPEYLRVNPILDWSYSEIWYFIRALKLPYCSLYEHGYTSLDSSTNTIPNKALLKSDGTYLPAYYLENEQLERESRLKYAKL
ncbi:unnamed protein product [Brachionus calyciflorus]|uniref:FAD synthase n=1 Tax=Brachionus calyciflorus TaxID=104777 RepID=A0A813R051_9BILA|nr:unnamed protein product [Brachionus calyciflorus]